jgi:hypothetical protein
MSFNLSSSVITIIQVNTSLQTNHVTSPCPLVPPYAMLGRLGYMSLSRGIFGIFWISMPTSSRALISSQTGVAHAR